ncbi:MAG: hypothetical protein ACRDDJ_05655, partial [[Mycobacterium] stephanolepidis]
MLREQQGDAQPTRTCPYDENVAIITCFHSSFHLLNLLSSKGIPAAFASIPMLARVLILRVELYTPRIR